MKYYKSIFIICLLILLVFMATASANDTENATVSNNDIKTLKQVNESPIKNNDSGTFTALQKIINDATSGSTINLDKDYTYDDGFSTRGIEIDKDLTINGNGHTIDALSKSRIILVKFKLINNNKVTLNNIKFKNGYTNLYGGAIFNYANLTVTNCDFINNYAKNCGGAVNSVGYLNCVNSKFNNNSANGDGGAVFTLSFKGSKEAFYEYYKNNTVDGSMDFILGLLNATISYGKDSVNNCVFTNNVAKGRGGGAIYALASIDIKSSTFTSNKAGEHGGAVFGSKNLYITGSAFTNNQVPQYGGAVYFKCHDQSGYYKNNKWVSEIIYYESLIQTSTFTKNTAKKGGAIYGFKTSSSDKHEFKVVKSTFSDNKAQTGRDIFGGTATNCIFNYLKLTLKTVKVKKSAKKIVLTSKLTKGKTLIKGKKITFKFNGKIYKAKTNAKGIAKVTIKKNVLKKLKVGKKITYQAKYNKLVVKKTTKVKK